MKTSASLKLLLLLVLMVITYSPIASAATTNDTIQVNVTISAKAEITVLPTSLNWTLQPSQNGTVQTVIIKNTGSYNVSSLYATPSTLSDEATNPLGTGDASKYASAGFVLVRNTTNPTFYHLGRLEWNLSSLLSGENLNLNPQTTRFGHGWYKTVGAGSNWQNYLWKAENGSNGYCNNTGTTFVIKLDPENATQQNRDLSTGLATCSMESAGANWSIHTCSNGPLVGHCVAVYVNCTKIYLFKYDDPTDTNFPACTNKDYLTNNTIVPADSYQIELMASVPEGVPAGQTAVGTVTITASY